MACSYRIYRNEVLLQDGAGETLEISSHTVKFKPSTNVAEAATEISISIPWPMNLEDGTRLQLVFSGTPIWEGPAFDGIRITRYEFRTRREKRENAPAVNRIPAYPQAPGVPAFC
jgi:hypothetical protein